MDDFVPNLEAQQRSLESYLEKQTERLCFNDWHERTGGDVREYGSYILSLPKLTPPELEDHIIRGEE